MTTRARSPMRRWRLFSPRDERTGEVSKWIQLDAVRTGRSGTRREEMRLRFRCSVSKKHWEAAVFVSSIINGWYGRVFPHFELGLQEHAGPNGVWIETSNKRGIVYSGDAHEFAQELVATEQQGQTNLRIQLRLLPHSRYPGSYTGTWNIEGVGAAVAWLEQQCKWKREALQPAPAVRPALSSSSRWESFEDTDSSTDKRRIGVYLMSSNYRANLCVRCTLPARGLPDWEAYIAWGQLLASEGPVEVMTQYGTGPMVIEDWSLSTNGEATFAPRIVVVDYDDDSLIRPQLRVISKLQETDRFAAGVVTADGEVLTATWDVAGLTEALQPVLAVARNALPAPWDRPI